MMRELSVLAAGLLGIGAWGVLRRFHGAGAAPVGGKGGGSAPPLPAAHTPAAPAVDLERVATANELAAERLWKLAFGAASQDRMSVTIDARVRDNVSAMLQVDTLDPKYFPRRPALLPQLLQAVNDPRAASDRLSRMIAHDPVLAADVLSLANSSLYRVSATPIETIQRAIVVCGVDALRGMLASAMLRPVFRATRNNFPRLPRMLWERTERAARAAELYALETHPEDRFEAQLVVLLRALGPLAVYSATLDIYARNPHFSPSGALCAELIGALAGQVSCGIAREWQTSPRLRAALETSPDEALTGPLLVGEFLGTLSFLESQTVLTGDERREFMEGAGLADGPAAQVLRDLAGNTQTLS